MPMRSAPLAASIKEDPEMSRVQTGLERLLEDDARLKRLHHKRVALLVNPTSVTPTYEHAIEALLARGVHIVRLFGPEHGVRAEAQDMEAVTECTDPLTQLPCVSLYGHTFESLQPTREQLADVDLVIADIQDIGTRYYTYAYTIGLMMKACGESGVSCWVLDRPNPLGGEVVEGNIVDDSCKSFVGLQPIATRHGMTLGELAHYFARHGGWSCDYEVIQMRGWRRDMWYDQTGLPWIMPSPNMPTLETAITYPGQCLIEGTTLSEGRGTTRPFELFGAPGMDAVALKQRLDAYDLPGVAWRAASFKPMFQKHAHTICRGVQLHITDRDTFRSLATTLCILAACREVSPEAWGWREHAYEFVDDVPAIDLLFGQRWVREQLEAGVDPRQISQRMDASRVDFDALRQSCLIY